MIDLHVHTWRCRHGEGTPEEFVREAARHGVSVVAFTEHLPLPPALLQSVPEAQGYAMPQEELGEYVSDVEDARCLGGSLGVEVLLGLEVDAVPATIEHARELLAGIQLDVVLGSVHFIDEWAFDDPDRKQPYATWRPEDLWARYFEELAAAARSGLADVIAHADLVKKFLGTPEFPVQHLYTEAARAIAEAGCAVEVNTAGLRKPCKEIYPSLPFLSELRRAGVPVTVGSDAHRPAELAAGWGAALGILEAAGYDSVVVFRQRRAEEVGLDELS